MITIQSPYGGSTLEVADDAVEVFLAAGYMRLSSTPPVVAKDAPEPPPQGGPGSGVKAWQKYALELGLAWAEDSEVTREEFIERIQEAGYPV